LIATAGLLVVLNKTILILGGTREALDLATALNPDYRVITSLAGRTKSPKKPAGELRIGGFGGAKALSDYLVLENIDIMVDATHPFAATISINAAEAAELANTPRIMLQRPPWQAGDGDQWENFATLNAAAKTLKPSSRCFLTIGWQELGAFKAREDVWFLVRMIDAPESPLPLVNHQVVTGLPQASADDEKILMQAHKIDTLITKNSGGILSAAKLEAARELGIQVMMIQRPQVPAGDVVETVGAIERWLLDR